MDTRHVGLHLGARTASCQLRREKKTECVDFFQSFSILELSLKCDVVTNVMLKPQHVNTADLSGLWYMDHDAASRIVTKCKAMVDAHVNMSLLFRRKKRVPLYLVVQPTTSTGTNDIKTCATSIAHHWTRSTGNITVSYLYQKAK